MKKPIGALDKDEAFRAKPLYCVYAYTHRDRRGRGGDLCLIEVGLVPSLGYPNWFNGKYGWFFDNYFHALAYSLEQKAKYEATSRRT